MAESQIQICCASLPIGFGWSLCFAQRINDTRMSDAEGLAHSTLVNDIAKVVEIYPLVATLYHFVYVDNLGVVALEQESDGSNGRA